MGVFLLVYVKAEVETGLPHTRGGVSEGKALFAIGLKSSPHPWGCFLEGDLAQAVASVFPTPVGVFLNDAVTKNQDAGLPHTRGGVSGSPGQTPERL